MKNKKGFTLIELMVVVSIIGILASVAMPQYQKYIQRSEVVEAISMATGIREKITAYYLENLSFPVNNAESGVPEYKFLIGNRIKGVAVENGAINVTLGHKASMPLQDKTLTFRPAIVKGSPLSPISWLCGFDEPVPGMEAVGENKTDLSDALLPSSCRQKVIPEG